MLVVEDIFAFAFLLTHNNTTQETRERGGDRAGGDGDSRISSGRLAVYFVIMEFMYFITALFILVGVQSSIITKPYRVSFVLGAPASGKSTQCTRLVNEYGCVHLSAGDLLREERSSGSSTAELIESYITSGAIVPVKITLDLIKSAMLRSKAKRFLIDGFPRNRDNLDGWDREMAEVARVDSTLLVECPEHECERRILERAKVSGRSDDNLATLSKRFATFQEQTLPIVEYFEAQNRLVRVGGFRPIDRVYADFKSEYEEMVKSELLELSADLLRALDEGDADLYRASIAPDLLTIIDGGLSDDLWKLLRSREAKLSGSGTFDAPSTTGLSVASMQSTMSRPHVRLMGKSAVVSYVRLIQMVQEKGQEQREGEGQGQVISGGSGDQFQGGFTTLVCQETRVWNLVQGDWLNVHLHRVIT